MKRNEYILYSDKIKEDKNIAILSDLHIHKDMKKERLNDALETLEKIAPTHIVIPGDLYNLDESTIYGTENKACHFLKHASDIAEVIYVKGNIEQKEKLIPYGLYHNVIENMSLLCEKTEKGQENFISYDDMNIAGIEPRKKFYLLTEKERCEELLTKYRKYLEMLSTQCGKEKYNILLCHDPIIRDTFINYKKQYKRDLNFDLIISGHNHGGMFPTWLKPFLKCSKKVNLEWAYPSYTKGMEFEQNHAFIVSKGVTKFHSESGKLESLEKFHHGTIENVKILRKERQ